MTQREMKYPRLEVGRKTGQEKFRVGGNELATPLIDFWRWSASDLVSNATRGVLAEYIVATALGLADGVRSEWDAFDLKKGEIKIEVKSAAYLQSWGHENLSKIIFGIRQTKGWNSSDGGTEVEAKRQADIYVFCLLKHDEKDSLDPLDLDQWEFYLLRSSVLDERCVGRKTINLESLKRLNPLACGYEGIAGHVELLSLEVKNALQLPQPY